MAKPIAMARLATAGFFLALSGVKAHTFCARGVSNHRYHFCPIDVHTSPDTTDDPIHCIDEPDGYRSDFLSLAEYRWNGDCEETQLIDNVPQGLNESVAVNCGRIPTVEEDEWVDLNCYYDQVTQEFCGSISGKQGSFQCFPLDSRAAFPLEDGSCDAVTEIKAGSCDEDIHVLELELPEVTEEYLNGRNRRVLEARHPCSFLSTGAQLDYMEADDTRNLQFVVNNCISTASAPQKCEDPETYELHGKKLLEVGNMLVQRQGTKTDSLCFLFQHVHTNREDCEAKCFNIEQNRGRQREISSSFVAIDADNWFSEEIYVTIQNFEDPQAPHEEKPSHWAKTSAAHLEEETKEEPSED